MTTRHLRQVLSATIVLLSVALSAASRAEPIDLSIGRLNYAGFSDLQHCTASLVAPRVAVTAFHCLVEDNVPDMHLLLGYDRGQWNEHLRPLSAQLAAGTDDTALLCLDRPSAVAPLALAARPVGRGEPVVVIGYGKPQVYVANRTACRVTETAVDGAFRMDCPLTPGTSGAPVLRDLDGAYEIVGVVSATNETSSLAFGFQGRDVLGMCD